VKSNTAEKEGPNLTGVGKASRHFGGRFGKKKKKRKTIQGLGVSRLVRKMGAENEGRRSKTCFVGAGGTGKWRETSIACQSEREEGKKEKKVPYTMCFRTSWGRKNGQASKKRRGKRSAKEK